MTKINRQLFDHFWNKKGQYLRLKNAERLHQNLADQIEKLGDTEALDFYICSLKKGKETSRKVVVDFYHHLEETGYAKEIVSSLYEKHFYDYPFERQLEIAKFLHEEKTPADIQRHFDIDERTMRKDLQELEEGIQVLGSTIQIQKEKHGRSYYYRTTLHPVFLPLNLTEVYALTVYLNRVIADHDPNAQIIRNISARVRSQLSDYAMNRIYPEDSYERGQNTYLDDEQMARQREGIVMYLMKSGQLCRFIWKEEEYSGRIRYRDGNYLIQLESGELLDARLEDVDFIIESLDYK